MSIIYMSPLIHMSNVLYLAIPHSINFKLIVKHCQFKFIYLLKRRSVPTRPSERQSAHQQQKM